MHVEIPKAEDLEEKVFSVHNEKEFASIALALYHFQFHNNKVYHDYCTAIGRTPDVVSEIREIPFLPIRFFKTHTVVSTTFHPQTIFQSSGTTNAVTSRHYVRDLALYEKSFLKGFRAAYGPPEHYCFQCLLPSYLEREGSSLVYMADRLIRASGHERSGFYLNNLEELAANLEWLESVGQKTILLGVTYALLQFAENFGRPLSHTLVMETGGMKGKAKELTRHEVYEMVKQHFGPAPVHSEYGMTELLSQAYGQDGIFTSPPWMRIFLRDETDPLSLQTEGTGAINVMDLANIYSCCFIATEDMGRLQADGSFEVLGRMDNSDVRGCSLMVV